MKRYFNLPFSPCPCFSRPYISNILCLTQFSLDAKSQGPSDVAVSVQTERHRPGEGRDEETEASRRPVRWGGVGGGGLCVSVIVDHEFFFASFTHLVSSSALLASR